MRSKRYIELKKKIDSTKVYSTEEALNLIQEGVNTKFDETIELALRLNTKKQKEQIKLRGMVGLPHFQAKAKRILAIVEDSFASDDLKKAGAKEVGGESLIAKIAKEKKVDFDTVITTPAMMPKIAKIAKILGPKGIMPNPKSGTISKDPVKLVETIVKGNKIEFKSDNEGNIHLPVGKSSQKTEEISANIGKFIGELKKIKPEVWKGEFVLKTVLSSTMGPAVTISI